MDELVNNFRLVGIGFIGGFLSGFLGIGGAVILIPLLVFLGGLSIQYATGSSITLVLVSTLVALFVHLKHDTVDKSIGIFLATVSIPIAYGGALLSKFMLTRTLEWLFTILIVFALCLLLFPCKSKGQDIRLNKWKVRSYLAGISAFFGFFTGLLGIGGGFILVPMLRSLLNLPIHKVIGISLLVVFFNTLATVAGKIQVGFVQPYWTLMAIAGSMPGAILGARMSVRVNSHWIEEILKGLLILILLKMMHHLWWNSG